MRKKVLILGHNDIAPFVDVYNQYASVFDPARFEVTVAYLTHRTEATTQQQTRSEHVLFLNLPKPALKRTKLRAINVVFKLCKRERFDIVICHRYKPTYIMLWVAQFIRFAAVICIMHEFNTVHSLGRKLLIGCLQRKNILFAGVSDAVRDEMRQDLWTVPNRKILTLYNMIDVETVQQQFLTRAAARQRLQLSDDAFVIGNVARLAKNKDQLTLIDGFAAFHKTCPQAKLMLIGVGAMEARLRARVREHQLEAHIIFTGYLADAAQYMQAFDVFVLTSIQEAFGRVLLEALIAQIPIIATRIHGIPEVLGDTNILINPQDSHALVTSMKKIYLSSQEYRLQKAKKAYDYVLNKFSITRFREVFWKIPLVQPLVE